MDNILTAATVILAIVLGGTQVVKQLISDNKYLPIINVVLGGLIGVAYAITIVKGDVEIYAWAGLIAGLSAGGFYDLGANGKAIVNQTKSTKLIDSGLGGQDNREEGE